MGSYLKPGIDPLKGNWTDDDFDERIGDHTYLIHVDTLAEATAIMFLDPAEFVFNKGPVRTPTLYIPFKGKSSDAVSWDVVSGTGYDDLTLTPSILVTAGEHRWHGFITNGEITNC